ncbi:MAG: hypothetical protein M9933_12570 [Chitinophagaceae bacterium]|nr:hypothetical protein [Chitinophagaceae bacterium]
MKKLMILSAAAILFTSVAGAQTETALRHDMKKDRTMMRKDRKKLQKLEGNDVSYQAKQQFLIDFNNAPVISSERNENYDEFTFLKDGKTTKAYYDADATLIGTIQMKTFADLPAKAQQHITKWYKDYTVGDVILFDDNEANEADMILYGTQFDDEDSYFAELQKDTQKIVVHIMMDGDVSYFTQLR